MSQDALYMESLMARVFSGEATSAEQEELRSWIARSSDNARVFREAESAYIHALGSVNIDVNVEHAWDRVKSTINPNSQAGGRVVEMARHFPRLRWLAGAAAVACLIGGLWMWMGSRSPYSDVMMAATENEVRQELPGGTMASLSKGGELHYSYDKSARTHRIMLNGSASFDVKKKPGESLEVQTGELMIRDIGTVFSVRESSERDTVWVEVEEGVVRMYSRAEEGPEVRAGEQGIYLRREERFISSASLGENDLSFPGFEFRDVSLKKVVKKLNESHEIPIVLASEEVGRCRISVTFTNEDIRTIALVLAETLDLELNERNGTLELSGEGCE